MFLYSIERTLALNSILLLSKTSFLNLCRSRTYIYRTFLNVSLSLFRIRIIVKHILTRLKCKIISLNLYPIDLFWIDQLVHVVYTEFELEMLRQILPFVIFNIWNLNRMNVQLTCVNDWVSNCKDFSNKAKCSNCNPIDLLKTVLRVAVFIKAFDVDA